MQITWVEASDLEQPAVKDEASAPTPTSSERAWAGLNEADGILVPGGFGQRGVEGMIRAASFARRNGIPYLGICLGMQVGCTEPKHMGSRASRLEHAACTCAAAGSTLCTACHAPLPG